MTTVADSESDTRRRAGGIGISERLTLPVTTAGPAPFMLVAMVAKPRHGHKVCRECKRHPRECGELSKHGGLCPTCQIDRMSIAARQHAAKEGPAYEQWVRSMASWANELVDTL